MTRAGTRTHNASVAVLPGYTLFVTLTSEKEKQKGNTEKPKKHFTAKSTESALGLRTSPKILTMDNTRDS